MPPPTPEFNCQPVGLPGATEKVPSPATLICCPACEARVPVIAPLLNTMSKSLINCATSVGLASKSDRVIVTVPVPVTTVAAAFTGPPPVILPVGVMKLNTSAYAAEAVMSPVSNTPSLIIIGPSLPPSEEASQDFARCKLLIACSNHVRRVQLN